MHDANQPPPGEAPEPQSKELPVPSPPQPAPGPLEPLSAPAVDPVPGWSTTPDAAFPPDPYAPPPFDAQRWARTSRGLSIWFGALLAFGLGGLLLGQQELAFFAALSGLFIASQAADEDHQWRMLNHLLVWVVPLTGAVMFLTMAFTLASGELSKPLVLGLRIVCYVAAGFAALTVLPPVSRGLARILFRSATPSYTMRLAAVIVALTLLGALPGWFSLRTFMDSLEDSIEGLIDSTSLSTGLIGYVLLAMAGVGFLLRRNLRQTLARLGLGGVSARYIGVAVAGVGAMWALNTAAEWLQRTYWNDLWLQDQRMAEAIGGNLGVPQAVVLGLSAGIGEEITMRGALQPRLGIVLTALLFAALHVQYTWFGMVVILALGILLGAIRKRTNTTVVMAIHAAYDIIAVLAVPHS